MSKGFKWRVKAMPDSDSDNPISRLDKTLSGTKTRSAIESARIILDESTEKKDPDNKNEVVEATETLKSAVDYMVDSLLFILSKMGSIVHWNKAIAAGTLFALITAGFVVVKIEDSAEANRVTAAKIDASRKELQQANEELQEIKKSLTNIKVEMAKTAVDQAVQPKIVPGDRPGEVAIVTQAINPKELEKAKEKAAKAVQEGKEPPPLPQSDKATRVPAQLKPAEVKELDEIFTK